MATKGLVARAEVAVKATAERVWRALTDPAELKQFMFGSTVESTFRKGAPITFAGEWQGKPYKDKGEILAVEPNRLLSYSHYSPMMGKPDRPENYHTVTITLAPASGGTRVTLEQDNNDSEQARAHSAKNWEMMLAGLKKQVDGG